MITDVFGWISGVLCCFRSCHRSEHALLSTVFLFNRRHFLYPMASDTLSHQPCCQMTMWPHYFERDMSKVVFPLRNQHVPFLLSPAGDRQRVDQVLVLAQIVATWRKGQTFPRLGSSAVATSSTKKPRSCNFISSTYKMIVVVSSCGHHLICRWLSLECPESNWYTF